jgi:hypothetical protein
MRTLPHYLPIKLRKIIARIKKHMLSLSKIRKYSISKTVYLYIVSNMSLDLYDQAAPYWLMKLRKNIAWIRKHWVSFSRNRTYLKNGWFLHAFKYVPAFA